MKIVAVIFWIFIYEVFRWLIVALIKHGASEKEWHDKNMKP